MRLPRLPNNFVKSRAHTVQFLGINLTENTQDGEMSDCKGLSTLQYPTLSQRKGRETLENYGEVTDVYEWDGGLITVSGGVLYRDGVAICSVNDQRKQFAVVNSRLVIFPDKIAVDLRNNEYTQMAASVITNGTAGSVSFTSNTLTATIESRVESGKSFGWKQSNTSGPSQTWAPHFYVYGSDKSAVIDCWDSATSSWDITALAELRQVIAIGTYAKNNISGSIDPYDGMIFIPEMTETNIGYVYGFVTSGTAGVAPDTTKYNDQGVFGVVTEVTSSDEEEGYWYGTNNRFNCKLIYDVYTSEGSATAFDAVFQVGDCVDITGTLYGLLDTTYNGDDTTTSSKHKITAISDYSETSTNVLTFADGTFNVPLYAKKFASDLAVGDYYLRIGSSGNYSYYRFTTTSKIYSGQCIVLYSASAADTTVYVWDIEKHRTVKSYKGSYSSSEPSSRYTFVSIQNYNSSSTVPVTIERSVPDLDFICERDNRLWGVSNNDKTIYCSALGIPWSFYDYSGLDTGSYAVAVGSSGDFTGIVSYGGVLCFKEDKVHKMLGSFPSDFYMTTYDVAGIQNGAFRSAVIISEILYYKSPLGVMAFTGYQPTNISPNLALENTTGGVGGTNGREYFLCVKAKDDDHYTLFKYDLQLKLWIKEDDIDVIAMADVGSNLYMAVHTTEEIDVDGQTITDDIYTFYLTGQQNDEGMELDWFAQFVPYIETGGGVKQVGYTRLILRFDMAPGSRFKIKVRYDNGLWENAWTQPATQKLTFTVPLRIRRCDKFELRLEGKGQTKVRSIQREFVRGGWFENGSGFY